MGGGGTVGRQRLRQTLRKTPGPEIRNPAPRRRHPMPNHRPVIEQHHPTGHPLTQPDTKLGLLTPQRPLARRPPDPAAEPADHPEHPAPERRITTQHVPHRRPARRHAHIRAPHHPVELPGKPPPPPGRPHRQPPPPHAPPPPIAVTITVKTQP